MGQTFAVHTFNEDKFAFGWLLCCCWWRWWWCSSTVLFSFLFFQ